MTRIAWKFKMEKSIGKCRVEPNLHSENQSTSCMEFAEKLLNLVDLQNDVHCVELNFLPCVFAIHVGYCICCTFENEYS